MRPAGLLPGPSLSLVEAAPLLLRQPLPLLLRMTTTGDGRASCHRRCSGYRCRLSRHGVAERRGHSEIVRKKEAGSPMVLNASAPQGGLLYPR